MLVAAVLAALTAAAVAAGDNLQNDVVDSSGIVTAAPGSSVAIGWRIHETGHRRCVQSRHRRADHRVREPLRPRCRLRLRADLHELRLVGRA